MDPGVILIIDDNKLAREAIQFELEEHGYEPLLASSTAQALSVLKEKSVDLIISDLILPDERGFSFIERIKEDLDTAAIPVIGVSDYDSEINIRNSFKHGADAFVSKKEIEFKLLSTVREYIERARFQKNKRILVVDDSASICKLVESGLTKAGFNVQIAADGLMALQLLEKSIPDLILSDIDMPNMDGMQFCQLVKQDKRLSQVPFVVMSANTDRASIRMMVQRGATTYVAKPFILDQLVFLVERLLSDQFQLIIKERERLAIERNMLLASIEGLVSALEARDVYTGGHSFAVSKVLTEMLRISGAGQVELERAETAGKLHDIGKIGIADSVLLKPERLTTKEYDIIKQHPVIGKRILESIPSLKGVMPIVLHHHERYDGNGYPSGLQGKDIPLYARMTSVADTFHALTSNRPYRKRMSIEEAFSIIKNESGKQFCPEVLELFFSLPDTIFTNPQEQA